MNFIDFSEYEKVYCLSHTDLDGYGSQLMSDTFLEGFDIEIEHINADYGEVSAKLKYITKQILKDSQKNYVLLITDLGLDYRQAKEIDAFLKEHRGVNLAVQLLDHHESHIENASRYDWYFVDKKRCATMLTYNYFSDSPFVPDMPHLEFAAKMVQAYDLWIEDDEHFGKGSFLANTIFSFLPQYPKVLKSYQVEHYMFVIREIVESLKTKSVEGVQREIFDICNRFYAGKIEEGFSRNENMSSEAKYDRYLFHLSKPVYRNFEKFTLEDKRYKVMYDFGNSFQNVSKYILREVGDVDFLILVHKTQKVSLRGAPGVNVAEIAQRYFDGGGHAQASGGRLKLPKGEVIRDQKGLECYFRENFNY